MDKTKQSKQAVLWCLQPGTINHGPDLELTSSEVGWGKEEEENFVQVSDYPQALFLTSFSLYLPAWSCLSVWDPGEGVGSHHWHREDSARHSSALRTLQTILPTLPRSLQLLTKTILLSPGDVSLRNYQGPIRLWGPRAGFQNYSWQKNAEALGLLEKKAGRTVLKSVLKTNLKKSSLWFLEVRLM